MSAQADKRTTRFDAEAASYDASKPYLLPWADEAAKTLVSYLPKTSQQPLIGMELGCGTGLVSQRVLKSTNPPVAFILGVDASEGMITAFNAKAAALAEDNGLVSPGSPLTLESPPRGMYAVYCMIEDDSSLRQSVAATPFADVLPTQDFDFVVSHITWHHIRDLNAMAKHIWRLLKPGGVFLIVDYEKTSDSIEFHPPSGRSEVEHLWGFSKDDLRGHLEGAGFVHVETRDVLTFERTGKDDGVTRKFTFIGAKGVKE
ncbi:S-adenosyl-L-methionine-dependent methyltransferase [Gonapodya prolifera JEL478]|uniref:S-adenosyl-L-methionine-dependent methyltransferase n=1 Tax=Gonapodya prolifera (strain JEL478) TaxID=1344416 RepID=A0A139AHI5_GONPJ|nr:S-adenosyl-L-methionine-dependent methyltransferase [Gonapodya prolifera JEL478]|eukprot:KXS16149.1 S-adenosyl-L-methionine-dependent methyltransferase [Gonapodya prolifera JEL478]